MKFVKENHLSDAECLHQALAKACASDNILDNTMRGKGIILQKAIPGKSRLCNIEEEDEISTVSDVTVLLIDLNPAFSTSLPVVITSSTMNCTQNLESEYIMEKNINDIPFIIQEQADTTNNLALDKSDVQVRYYFMVICNLH